MRRNVPDKAAPHSIEIPVYTERERRELPLTAATIVWLRSATVPGVVWRIMESELLAFVETAADMVNDAIFVV